MDVAAAQKQVATARFRAPCFCYKISLPERFGVGNSPHAQRYS